MIVQHGGKAQNSIWITLNLFTPFLKPLKRSKTYSHVFLLFTQVTHSITTEKGGQLSEKRREVLIKKLNRTQFLLNNINLVV